MQEARNHLNVHFHMLFLDGVYVERRDGTAHAIVEPLDFIARLATLVPKPRVNLTLFHGVFAPNRSEAEVTKPQAESIAVTANTARG